MGVINPRIAVLIALSKENPFGTYGRGIQKKVESLTGKCWPAGSVYTTLDRMTVEGLVKVVGTKPTPVRSGGNSRKYFAITAKGRTEILKLKRATEDVE